MRMAAHFIAVLLISRWHDFHGLAALPPDTSGINRRPALATHPRGLMVFSVWVELRLLVCLEVGWQD